MLKGNSLLDYMNSFSPSEYEMNDKIILKYFRELKMFKVKKIYWIKCKKYKKFENPEISYLFYKTLIISIICGKCGSKHKRTFKEEESMETLKILGLTENI